VHEFFFEYLVLQPRESLICLCFIESRAGHFRIDILSCFLRKL